MIQVLLAWIVLDGGQLHAGNGTASAETVVEIATPARGEVLSNVYCGGATEVSITGRAAGPDLAGWILDAGPGEAPVAWTRLATDSKTVSSGTLAVWRTSSFPNARYTLRLRAWGASGNVAQATTRVTLANFALSQDTLQVNAAAGEVVTYRSVAPFALTEELLIMNAGGRVVRTLAKEGRAAATYFDVWDGRDDAGDLVPDGPYLVIARVDDGEHTMTWDQRSETIGSFFDAKEAAWVGSFDPFNNRPLVVRYSTPVPGCTTISVFSDRLESMTCDQPPERALCLVVGQYEPAGEHEFAWAGLDAAGVYRGENYSQLSITTTRDCFARSAVLLYGTKPSVRNVTADPPSLAPPLGATMVGFDLSTYQNRTADVVVSFVNQAALSTSCPATCATLRTIKLEVQRPGHVSVRWDGRSDGGAPVAPGSYTVTVAATDRIGNRVQGQIIATVSR